MQELLKEYRKTLSQLQKSKEQASEEEIIIITGMISDIEYAIEWMSTARRPGNKRGIERRAGYQREVPFDPIIIQRYFRSTANDVYEWDDHLQEDCITLSEKERIEESMKELTPLERETYLMSRGHSLSYSEISDYYNVSESTIKTRIKRAEEKIAQEREYNIFCLDV